MTCFSVSFWWKTWDVNNSKKTHYQKIELLVNPIVKLTWINLNKTKTLSRVPSNSSSEVPLFPARSFSSRNFAISSAGRFYKKKHKYIRNNDLIDKKKNKTNIRLMQILTSKGFPESLIFPRITPTMKERNFHGISRTLSFVLGYSNILTTKAVWLMWDGQNTIQLWKSK